MPSSHHRTSFKALSLSALILLMFALVGIVYINYPSTSSDSASLLTSQPPDTSINEFVANNTIRVGLDATYPPMEFIDEDGKLKGYDVDLAQELADTLNADVEFKNIPWASLFNALNNNEVDIVISSVTITNERRKSLDFSTAYLNAGQVIVAQTENTSIKTPTDLAGKTVGVQKDTTNEQSALEYTDPNLVITFASIEGAANALITNEVAALITDLPNAKSMVENYPILHITGDPFTSDYYGVVFRKNEQNFVQLINHSLNKIRQQGTLITLKEKWLN